MSDPYSKFELVREVLNPAQSIALLKEEDIYGERVARIVGKGALKRMILNSTGARFSCCRRLEH